ncbi:MAG: hypothetical protein VX224_00885 [Candidatus Thermoplasmatota archaeon]|nr:hypothetical protein [Candidatus Thermoplasmatota archaeon]
MEENSAYEMPPTDTSPFSLVMWAQFGFFALILTEFNQNTEAMGAEEYVFLGAVLVTALLQLLRVNNRRMIGMLLMMAAAVVSWGVIGGEMEEAIFGLIFFIIPFFGMVIYIPALGFDEHGMELPRERRKLILVIVMSLCMVFFTVMENIDLATTEDGTYVTEDMDGDIIYEVDDMNVNLAKASMGLAVMGVLILLATTLGGMALGGLRPWHGVAIAACAAWLDGYNWSDFGQDPLWMSCLWALMITVMFVGTAREFFEKGEETTG